MSGFPAGTEVMLDGITDWEDASVLVTEFERGPRRYEAVNSRVSAYTRLTLYFATTAAEQAFRTWYRSTLGRVGEFDFVHPLTGQTHRARFKDGDIGELTFLSGTTSDFSRTVVLEYTL